jgi:hypothetical protein
MKISWNRGIYPQLSSIFFSDFPYIILSTELVLIGAKLLGLGVARHPGWTARRRWSRRWGRRGGKMDDMMRTWHIYVLYTTSMYDMYIYICINRDRAICISVHKASMEMMFWFTTFSRYIQCSTYMRTTCRKDPRSRGCICFILL